MSRRRVVSEEDGHIVVQEAISSAPSSFVQFFDAGASFVDKTLAIEAFLRDPGSHHLILRPRHCGKSYTLSMIQEFLQRPLRPESEHSRAKTTSRFASTAITDPFYRDLVSTHFQQYPVLYVDLKDVHGTTFKDMQTSFDAIVIRILKDLSNPTDGVPDQSFLLFCDKLYHEQVLLHPRGTVLQVISQILQKVFMKPVVVLIDEYDTPIHSAIEHNYADDFFATVFGSLLKNNDAVFASMMVGICNVVESGQMASSLNHLEIFPMHGEDDRYAIFFPIYGEGSQDPL
ncbi:AAA-ATPase-like domain containing protein [Amanita muscaria]